jgi:hypothetical protein
MNTTSLASVARLAAPLALVAALSLTVAACSSGAAAPSAAPTASPPSASPQPSPADPDGSVTGPSDPGLGGGGDDPGDGGAIVIPHPGTFGPHPVGVQVIEPSVDGRRVTVKLTWTSGVAPCYVLDSVIDSRGGNDIELTVVEGSADKGAVCIEIAQTKSTIVDLGELAPGEYTIRATDSEIPPVTITVA